MANSYTRQSSFSDGDTINAGIFNDEYDQLVLAFSSTTGHTHDGSTGQGGVITKVGPAQDIVVSGTTILPKTSNAIDLGSSTYKFKDAYFAGNITADGSITYNGNVTIGDSSTDTLTINATIQGGSLLFEGATADAFETTLAIPDATADITITLPNATDTLVGKATTDTLTNKTLTSPVISSISNTGTITFPTSTDTLVGRATTDTLTNKTITSPTINTPTITGNTTFSDGSYDFNIASHDGTNGLKLGGTLVTATATELNLIDGVTATTAELNIMDGVTATAAELNILDGVTATASELNIMDGVTATTAEINIMDGVTATAAELNIMDGVTATAAELNILDGVTASATEINLIDGVTATTIEINYIDGVTSSIQTQMNTKAPLASPTLTGTPLAPTATAGTNTTQVATTAFVTSAVTSEDTLAEMNDVTITSVADNEVVAYDSTTSKFINQTAAEAGLATSSDLTSHTGSTSNPHSVTATQVSLGNVTNESKATMFTSPTLTGTPLSTTAVAGTNTTQIATTAFVTAAVTSEDTLAEMNDTTISAPADSHFLVHTGSAWVNETGATARTSLGVDASGTDNSTNVTLSGTPNYITISGQVITVGTVDIGDDTNLSAGTGITLTGDSLSVDYGTTSGTAAEGNHTHTGYETAGDSVAMAIALG
jgi:hypothetical protein